MRGIAFIGGEGPGAEDCRRLVAEAGGPGAEEEVLIVAADSGLLLAEAAEICPHLILGDMDSLGDLRRLEKYPPGRVLLYPPDKDYTDTELALGVLRAKGAGETWIIGGGGGRLDHLLAIRALFERERPPRRWITAGEEVFFLDEGETLAPPVSPGGLLSVFPLGGGPWAASSRSLQWPLDGLSWTPGIFGLSNRAEPGVPSVRVLRGRFLIVIPKNREPQPGHGGKPPARKKALPRGAIPP